MADRRTVLEGVKGRMQSLRDELDNLKDDYDRKCKECIALVDEKNQVNLVEFISSVSFIFLVYFQFLLKLSLNCLKFTNSKGYWYNIMACLYLCKDKVTQFTSLKAEHHRF